MKHYRIKISVALTIIATALFALRPGALPTVLPELCNKVSNLRVSTAYCDLRQYPVPPAVISTDMRQLAHRKNH